MKWFILDNVVEVFVTDSAGIPYQADILDDAGMSLLSGEIITIDPPVLLQPFADVSLEVGAERLAIDLREFIGGEQLTFSRSPMVGTLDGYTLTLDPVEAMDATEVSVTGRNSEGEIVDAFLVTFTAPIVVEPEPVSSFAALTTTDDVLFVGSSDVGCVLFSTWSPWDHNFPSVFRTDYAGLMTDARVDGRNRPGMASAITFGRMSLPTIIQNAQGGAYGLANPLTQMGLYDALVIDTSDNPFGQFRDSWQYPNMPDYHAITNMPAPYSFMMQTERQMWMNDEMEARMRLIRLAAANGTTKVFLCSPWVRLTENETAAADTTDVGDAIWFSKFAALEDSMHYQQDRLNYQCAAEGLDIEVWLLPFHVLLRDLYQDIQAGTAPAGITSIRNVFAHGNNLDTVNPVTDPTIAKHWYMLNYLGSWAINALFDAIALGGDPRTKPRTDGQWTVPEPIASYFANKAMDLRASYERAGPGQGYLGYVMPEILEATPTQLLGTDLAVHLESPAVGTSYPLTNAGPVRHLFAVLDLDLSVLASYREVVVELVASGGATIMLEAQINEYGRFYCWASVTGPVQWEDVMVNGLPVEGARQRVMVEFRIPHPGWTDPVYGHNAIVQATNMDLAHIPWERDKWGSGAHMVGGLNDPTIVSARAPHAQHRVLDVIAAGRPLSGPEVFEVQRYLSRKHQAAIYEPLWPDLVAAQ